MTVEIVKFTAQDMEEFKDIPGVDVLNECMRLSQNTWKGMIDGQTACVWGIVTPTIISTQCYIWLMTTEIAERHQFILVRWSQIVIKGLLKEYEMLVGHVMKDQHRSQRWLKWLGAEFEMPTEKGNKIPFKIRRK